MKPRAVLILALTLALLVAPFTVEAQSPGDRLIGRTWRLLRYGDIANPTRATAGQLPGSGAPTLTFGADGILSGVPGCNEIRAAYEIASDRLKLRGVGRTLMACEGPELFQQESAVVEGLRSPSARLALEGNQLKIFYADGKKALVFEQVIE